MRATASLAQRLVKGSAGLRPWLAVPLHGWLLVLCLLGGTCGPQTLRAPFLDVKVTALPPGVTELQVDASFAGKMVGDVGRDGMLDRFTISLPSDARGDIAVQATARDAAGCIVAVGQLSQSLTENQLYQLTLTMSAQTPPICPGSGPVSITVTKTGGGSGSIVATPAALSCDSTCVTTMADLQPGTIVSLSIDSLSSGTGWTTSFDGWSGACTGTSTCFITLAQATTVTAHLTCHGWCREDPLTETTNLNAVWGFGIQRVVAVGDGGRIMRWDGTSWQRGSVLVSAHLRAVNGGIGSMTGFAVGDAGTILQTTDQGTNWAVSNSMTTRNLRGVWVAGPMEAYAVGDNIGGNFPWLGWGGTSWTPVSLGGVDYTWNAICGLVSPNYWVVGTQGRGVARNPFQNPTPATTNSLNGIYGTTSTDMTAVGAASTLLRYNPGGATWTAMSQPSGTGSVTLRAIHGSATNAMFAVGDSGTVWFYDGSMWSVEPFPSIQSQLNGVFVFSPTNVYVVGQGGVIYHKK